MTTTQERIKMDVVDELAWDDRVLATDVSVDVDDGMVTLSGHVPTHFSRKAAIEDAYRVPDVAEVVDRLDVRYPDFLETPTDERIQSNAENVLSWNPDIAIVDVAVSVADGVVTLEGTVDAYWKKLLAENLVLGLSGVIEVENHLAIVPTENVSDQSIAGHVTKALERRLQEDADAVDVTVEEGLVTLSGVVPSVTDEEIAFDAARYTAGVQGVRNNMAVAP